MPAKTLKIQSFIRFPLTHLFSSGANVRVLRALSRRGTPMSTSQLVRSTQLSPQGARNALMSLIDQGMVLSLGEGRSQLYAMRTSHPMLPALEALFEAEEQHWRGFLEELTALLRAQSGLKAAWLYGSVARGEDHPHSDVDLVALFEEVREGSLHALRDALASLEARHQLRISLVALSAQSIGELDENSPWWANALKDARLLVGELPERIGTPAPQLLPS